VKGSQRKNSKFEIGMLVTNRGFDDPRVCMEAETLVQAGYSVAVIGWDRDANEDSECQQAGVRFIRLCLRSTHGRGLIQLLFLTGFWLRAWCVLRHLRPKVIHCHDLDTLVIGWLVSWFQGSRLVFDAHENFPDMMVGHLPAAAVWAMECLEACLVPRSRFVITVGERLARHFRRMRARKVIIVGNWKNPKDFFFPPGRIREARRNLGLDDGIITICYITNLGPRRRLEPLLAAVARNPRFACVIGGTGPQAPLAKQYAEGYKNIIYLGQVPRERVALITASCDLVYSGYDERGPDARWAAPNKMHEAIAAGKPLLTNDFGEIGEVIRQHNCGILVETATREGIASGLESITRSALEAMGRRSASLQGHFYRAHGPGQLREAYCETLGYRELPGE